MSEYDSITKRELTRKKLKRYYDYTKIDSYGAPLRVIIGGRRLGKTFGARRKCIEKNIDKGKRFVWIVENTILQGRLQSNNGEMFFNNIKRYYKRKKDKTNARYLSKLEKIQVDENTVIKETKDVIVRAGAVKIDGNTAGYIIALSDFAKAKGNDFGTIDFFIADEFIPEVLDKRSRDNVKKLVSILESAVREHNATVYMFSNTTNITDDIAMRLGIHKQKVGTVRKLYDEYGLLGVVDFVDENEYALHKEEVEKSVSGRIAKFFGEDRLHKNQFKNSSILIIPPKRGKSNRVYVIQLEGKTFSFERAEQGGFYIFQVTGTTGKLVFNNFKFGQHDIKNDLVQIITTQKVMYDTHLTATLFYDKLGLDYK